MKYLLIGGPRDGQRMDLDGSGLVRLPDVIEQYRIASPGEPTDEIKTTVYERRRISGRLLTLFVYVEKGMSDDEMLEKLIENYKPERI